MKIDKLIIYFALFIVGLIFVWNYSNTCTANNNRIAIEEYTKKVDSLEVRVQKLEYLIENQPDIIINVNEITKNKQK